MDEPPHSQPKVSAVVVTHDRADLVERCLTSLCAQSERAIEVVVVLNGAGQEVTGIVSRFALEDSRVRPVAIPGSTASEARNRGVEAAQGSLLYFLDDDVEVPPEGLRAVVDLFAARPGVMIAGGPNLTPPEDSEFSQMSGELLASPFGTGITRYRYALGTERSARERHLTLCNLAVDRRLFDAGMRFPRPFGGEENVLMGHASELGHPFWYSPSLWVYHRRRGSLRAHLAQINRYGFGRGIAIVTAPGTLHPAYFAPLGLVLCALIALPGAALGAPWVLFPLVLYSSLGVVASLAIAVRRKQPTWVIRLPGLFLLTHVVYAIGLVQGLARGVRGDRRKKRAREGKSALDTS